MKKLSQNWFCKTPFYRKVEKVGESQKIILQYYKPLIDFECDKDIIKYVKDKQEIPDTSSFRNSAVLYDNTTEHSEVHFATPDVPHLDQSIRPTLLSTSGGLELEQIV